MRNLDQKYHLHNQASDLFVASEANDQEIAEEIMAHQLTTEVKFNKEEMADALRKLARAIEHGSGENFLFGVIHDTTEMGDLTTGPNWLPNGKFGITIEGYSNENIGSSEYWIS